MAKITINKDGWVCERYPWDIPITDDCSEVELSDEEVQSTYSSLIHYSWRYKDGKLSNELYEEISAKETAAARIDELKRDLADTDYKVLKYTEGELSEEEWATAKAERQAWRDEINTLQKQYNL